MITILLAAALSCAVGSLAFACKAVDDRLVARRAVRRRLALT